ncbi:uncharacterized protein Dana_GF23973 [Drosophila ananassae]|uniref:NTF2-related export protein n=1 Tax=Drosophila ananassae TaxID=7217 RepID=B3M3R6_DROAN|nr:probable nuclear transport factor 2 [Drosophila ananassae]EDV40359.1 uncharacterized protein Dana_GF23973 [Drosophila ananassae]
MPLNPHYEPMGQEFVKQYYVIFDNPATRALTATFFSHNDSFMTFEGEQVLGYYKIFEKVKSLPFQKVNRTLTNVDCQPTGDGGILMSVLGRLQCDDDPSLSFSQIFVLKPDTSPNAYYLSHDIFRLNIHDTE